MNKLKHDFPVELATGHSRMSKTWKNKTIQWSELVTRCAQTRRTDETAAEYRRMSREEQSRVKDVGGFVGAYLAGGTRKTTNVLYRTMLTLDIDYGTDAVWDDFTLQYPCAAMMYSTHKHTAEKPRLRLVIPVSRQITPLEYEPCARALAASIGIDLFDDTTYETARLFYWPSTSKDAPYVFEYQDGPALNPDELLGTYKDWHDASQWPLSSREGDIVRHAMRQAGDPTEKPGIIGAFCRAYTIEEAIQTFLADKYEPTATPDRYTYTEGSVAGGLVCYDGRWAYSHHETDPASRQLCNAFDLVRVHLYGVRDEGSRAEDVTRRPSYAAMQELAAQDARVRVMLMHERQQQAAEDFGHVVSQQAAEELARDSLDWTKKLDTDKKGNLKPTAMNAVTILEHDPNLAGRLYHDDFTGLDMVRGGLPWNAEATQWGDKDDANLRVYIERCYGMQGKDKIRDGLDAVLTRHHEHPIREYLEGLTWDGTPRLDTLFIDYVGAEDNELNRAFTRKFFTAAVARIFDPGCKWDYCPILKGKEGIGKSSALAVMGGEWFSDSLVTIEGREGMEQVTRSWLLEVPEMSAMKKAEVEPLKAFLTKRSDIFRAAYGRAVMNIPRHCVFAATTNEEEFLRGTTGNRRFWVIDLDPTLRAYDDPMTQLRADRDQLWAEAVARYRGGERLYLTKELEAQARARQDEHNEDLTDPTVEIVRQYLDEPLPLDWAERSLHERRTWINESPLMRAAGRARRDRVCVAEVVCERLGRNVTDREYKMLARKVGAIISQTPGWQRGGTSRHAESLYGRQLAWVRTYSTEEAWGPGELSNEESSNEEDDL